MLRRLVVLVAFASLWGLIGLPARSWSCPNCQETARASLEFQAEGQDDPWQEARAFNTHVVVMLALPAALVGGFGMYGSRQWKRQRFQARQSD